MEQVEYFFDTYAIIETLKQNPNYVIYESKNVTITIFNLPEIYYSVYVDYGKEKADEIYEIYKFAVKEISDEVIKEAVKFRKLHNKKRLSYTDCIGYIYAKHNKMKFLTGDKEFKELENVEFVK